MFLYVFCCLSYLQRRVCKCVVLERFIWLNLQYFTDIHTKLNTCIFQYTFSPDHQAPHAPEPPPAPLYVQSERLNEHLSHMLEHSLTNNWSQSFGLSVFPVHHSGLLETLEKKTMAETKSFVHQPLLHTTENYRTSGCRHRTGSLFSGCSAQQLWTEK